MNSEIGHASADSYVSLEFANTFFTNSIDSSAWPVSDALKTASLIEATRILDSQFDWYGDIAVGSTQALRWPRINTYDMDGRLIAGDVIPKILKEAVCNLAYFLLQNGGLNQTQSDVKGVKVGPINLSFTPGESVVGVPKYVTKSLQSLGSFQGHVQGSVYTANALRS